MHNYPPKDLVELQQRCEQIAGLSVTELAQHLHVTIPDNLVHAKGWVGQLVEMYLGASAGSKALPDFPDLSLELKTVPINKQRKPLESTYVCTVQANQNALSWHDSWVYHKLRQVLWVPILEQVIQKPIFWQMDNATEEILRTDWEELMELLQLGYAKNISAKFGTYLHIRPKAANSKILVDYFDADGSATKMVPKGFYLRTSFTTQILSK